MGTYTKKELNEILEAHKLWLQDKPNGIRADLSSANLSSAEIEYNFKRKITSNKHLISLMFETTDEGWVVYKSFGDFNKPPKKWNIKINSTIKHIIDTNRFQECSFGINVGTLEWCKDNCTNQIYKLLVPFTAEVCVPVWTDGKVRVSEAKILEAI